MGSADRFSGRIGRDQRDRRLASAVASVLVAACALATFSAARAEDTPLLASGPGYIVTVGGYGLSTPKFEGAKNNEFTARPIFGIRAPGSREWLDLPNDGLEYEFIETDNFRAGAVGNFRFARQTDSLTRGFSRNRKIDVSVEAGGFAEYWPALWLRTRAEVRNAFIGAEGIVADLSADLVTHPGSERFTFTAGPRLSLADTSFMNAYYGITPQQSANTGLAPYHANAGVRSYGAGTSLRYKWSDAWTTLGYVEYTHLSNAASDSPLIDSRGTGDMFTVGIGAKYSFHANW